MMKPKQNKTEKEEKRLTRRLFLWALALGLLSVGLLFGTLFYFFVPRDNDTYILTVPSLVGKNESELRGYTDIEIVREWMYSSTAPKGRIISQTPYGGARRKVRVGEKYELKIFVSLGDETMLIPDLSGVGAMSAAAALRTIHAQVRSVAIYDSGEDGRVLYTSPPSGSEIKAGDTVTIFVARERPTGSVTVPDFSGRTLAEACRIALAQGLYITENENACLEATVKGQSIPADTKVRRGSYISFITDESEEIKEREWPPRVEDTDQREDRE